MNKISKKIVSLITMAVFVLTLVPAAAFAADNTKVEDSTLAAVETSYNTVDVTVTVSSADQADGYANVVVWATDAKDATVSTTDMQSTTGTAWPGNDAYYYPIGNGEVKTTLTFAKAGDYTIHAALNPSATFAQLQGSENELTSVDVTPMIQPLSLATPIMAFWITA